MHTVDLADAIVTRLNAEDWDLEFTARRSLRDEKDLGETENLQVVVVPVGITSERETRTEVRHQMVVNLGIVQKAGVAVADMDAFCVARMDLAEAIVKDLQWNQLAGFSQATFMAALVDPIFDAESIATRRQFFTVIVLTYQVQETE